MVGGVQASDPNVSPGSGLNLVVRVPAVAVNNGSEKFNGRDVGVCPDNSKMGRTRRYRDKEVYS